MSAPKPKRGRPTYKPTPEQRAIVAALAGCGVPQDIICRYPEIACAKGTLEKVFADELRDGQKISNGMVAKTLFQQALDPKPGNPSTMFWLKCRAGWREKDRDEGGESESIAAARKQLLEELRKDLSPND